MSSPRAVLFDLDGTLLNTLEDLADSANGALGELGFPGHPVDSYRYFVGDGMENLVRRVLPKDHRDAATFARLLELTRREYSNRWSTKTQPYPGIPDFLDWLAGHCVPMAVLSNKPHEFTRLCVTSLLPRWSFQVIQGATPTLPKKPDPAAALAIASTMGVSPAVMLYLGDTNTDMRTAISAGMFPVGALWGFRTAEELTASGARVLVETPLEVARLIRAP